MPGRAIAGRVELALSRRLGPFPAGAADNFTNTPLDNKCDHVHHRAEEGPFEPSGHTAADSHDLVLSEAAGLGDWPPAVGLWPAQQAGVLWRIRALAAPFAFELNNMGLRREVVSVEPLAHVLRWPNAG